MSESVEDVDPSGYDDIVSWVLSLPGNGELVWGSRHVSFADADGGHVHVSWIDLVPVDDSFPLGWAWTVVTPDDDDAGLDATVLALPTDRDLYRVWDSVARDFLDGPVVVLRSGGQPDDEQVRALSLASVGDRWVETMPAWSSATVNDALTVWVAEHTGRTDLCIRFDATFSDVAADSVGNVAHVLSSLIAWSDVRDGRFGDDVGLQAEHLGHVADALRDRFPLD